MKRYMFSTSATLYTFCDDHPPKPQRGETVELVDGLGSVCGACEYAVMKRHRIDEPLDIKDVDEVDCQRLAEAVIKDAKINIDRKDKLYYEDTRKWITRIVELGSDLWHDILGTTPTMFQDAGNYHISRNDVYEWEGQSKTLQEWGKHYNISPSTIYNRVEGYLTNPEKHPYKSIFGPSRGNITYYEYNGMSKNVSEWARYLGLTPTGFMGRLKMQEKDPVKYDDKYVYSFKKDNTGRPTG